MPVNDTYEADSVLTAYTVIILAMCRCHVYDPCTACIRNERSANDHVDFICFDIAEWRSICSANQFRAFMSRKNLIVAFHYFFYKIVRYKIHAILLLYLGIIHIRINCKSNVCWQSPRRSRPGKYVLTRIVQFKFSSSTKVLHILIALSHFMRAK
ncbi:hypothetical protein D3C73_1288960 [compost metagenome]